MRRTSSRKATSCDEPPQKAVSDDKGARIKKPSVKLKDATVKPKLVKRSIVKASKRGRSKKPVDYSEDVVSREEV